MDNNCLAQNHLRIRATLINDVKKSITPLIKGINQAYRCAIHDYIRRDGDTSNQGVSSKERVMSN